MQTIGGQTKWALFAGVAAFAVLAAVIYAGGWGTRSLQAAATAPPLGPSLQNFAVLAAGGITNSGATVVTGDLGTHPTATVTGFFGTTLNDGPGTVIGAIHQADAAAQAARSALTAAYNNALGQTPDFTVPQELGGQNLGPGVYAPAADSFTINHDTTLTLTGDANAVWLFKTQFLITGSGSRVTLLGGAQACNVFWQVGTGHLGFSGHLGTDSTFVGTILARGAIRLLNRATVDGRVLAGAADPNGLIMLDLNTITRPPTCAARPMAPVPTTTSTATATATAPAATSTATAAPPTATATATATVAPPPPGVTTATPIATATVGPPPGGVTTPTPSATATAAPPPAGVTTPTPTTPGLPPEAPPPAAEATATPAATGLPPAAPPPAAEATVIPAGPAIPPAAPPAAAPAAPAAAPPTSGEAPAPGAVAPSPLPTALPRTGDWLPWGIGQLALILGTLLLAAGLAMRRARR